MLPMVVMANELTVPSAYYAAASNVNISPLVLYAVALEESGGTNNGVYRPWPWTITFNGKAQYFDDRESMLETLESILSDDTPPKQLGIGLMQVEWRYHKDRFATLGEAVDPYINLKVGTEILSIYLAEKGDLWSAIGRYHSGTEELAVAYQARVARRLVNYVLGQSNG